MRELVTHNFSSIVYIFHLICKLAHRSDKFYFSVWFSMHERIILTPPNKKIKKIPQKNQSNNLEKEMINYYIELVGGDSNVDLYVFIDECPQAR